MRRAAPYLLAVAVVAIVVVGLTQASGGSKSEKLKAFDLKQALTKLDGAPQELAALHRQHDQLLGGGTKAFKARLASLKGTPVVVNKWGSWCVPCRQEFPVFQRASTELGRRVAFLGVNFTDPEDEARKFLRQKPLTYPSYRDPHGAVSQAAGIPGGAPITLFVDAKGRTYIHQGPYRSVADLRADVKRYLHV